MNTFFQNIPKRFILVGMCFCATLICYIDRINISVAIIPMQEYFGWSDTIKGFVLSSFYIGYAFFQIPSGWLANKYGGKILMGVALIWWSFMTILTPLAGAISLGALIFMRIAMGAGETGAFPATYNLFSRWIPQGERSRSVVLTISGIPLGTLVALTTTGWIIESYNWQMVFYLFGGVGIVFSIFWYISIHNSPQSHPSILPKEKALLKQMDSSQGQQKIPWRTLLSKSAVWALIINHFCHNWGFYVLLSWLPSYFKQVQGLSITNAGIISAAPWLTMFVASNLVAWLADSLIKKGWTVTTVRKSAQIIGLVGGAFFLIFAKDAASPFEAVLLLCSSMGMLAFASSGFLPNHLDIAPRYADVLLSITNTAGTIPGIIGVLITGWLIDFSGGSYASVFILAASINIFGAIIWLFFGTGKKVLG